jgi:hypothetical protein
MWDSKELYWKSDMILKRDQAKREMVMDGLMVEARYTW